jgi:hypothetical protein
MYTKREIRDAADQSFELLMGAMGVLGNIVGDPPNDKKDDVKSDHPATFAESLRLNEDGHARRA